MVAHLSVAIYLNTIQKPQAQLSLGVYFLLSNTDFMTACLNQRHLD